MWSLKAVTRCVTSDRVVRALYRLSQRLTSEGYLDPNMEFRAFHDGTEETELFDVEVNKSANPFGDYAILYIDDSSGTRFDDYPRGTQVTVEEKDFGEANTAYTDYFVGYVVERRERNRQSGDVLEVEAYTFDQFLRRNTVESDESGNTISTALDNVISDDTPVTFVSGNVDVLNDVTLQRSYRGENVEDFLRSVASKSGGEDWGVNQSLEFFFQPPETERAPRDIDNTQWLDYDIPERGKRSVNQVRVFYDSGTKAVLLNDGGDQLELQNQIGASEGITLYEEVSRRNITNRSAAIDVAEEILSDKSPTLTGTVTTFGLQNAEPGDVINVTIDPRGIDNEFRVAENLTRWSDDSNQLTIVEKEGFQDDLLVDLTRDTKRVEMEDVDRTVTEDLIVRPTTGAQIDFVSSTVTDGTNTTSFNQSKMLNNGFRALRRGWLGSAFLPWDVDKMVVGSGDMPPSREDTSLQNQQDSTTSVTLTRISSNVIEFSATGFDNTSGLQEVGLVGTNGDLFVRGTFDSVSGSTVDVSFQIQVDDDPDIDRGVITNQGQDVLTDIIAANTPDLPVDYGVGDGTNAVSESDTSLSNANIVSISSSIPTGINTVLFETDYGTALANSTIAESGAFDTNGNLLTRARFVSRTLDSNQTLVTREMNEFRNA